LEPEWENTKRKTLSIGRLALNTLTQTQGITDLDQIYRVAQQDKADFNLAFIGADFDSPHRKEFDPEYMKRLFDYSYHLGAKGYPWRKSP
jgi:hypothetical protein